MKLWGMFLGLTVVAGAIGTFAFHSLSKPDTPQTFEELIKLSDDQLNGLDIARMNLICAKGLPGAEDLDIEANLAVLDQWAAHAKLKEQQYAPAFFQYREKYRNSQALFKAVYLGIAIEEDFKCGYNEGLEKSGAMDDRASIRFFHNPADIFIHGLTQEGKGSCSSLPVLMAALGQRCDYPIHLVACGGHLFNRWNDGSERFNLEITCKGVNTHSNEHYLKWPRPISGKEIAEENLMADMANREILAVFAGLRSVCFQEHGMYKEALFCEQAAYRMNPDSRLAPLRIKRLEKLAKGENK